MFLSDRGIMKKKQEADTNDWRLPPAWGIDTDLMV